MVEKVRDKEIFPCTCTSRVTLQKQTIKKYRDRGDSATSTDMAKTSDVCYWCIMLISNLPKMADLILTQHTHLTYIVYHVFKCYSVYKDYKEVPIKPSAKTGIDITLTYKMGQKLVKMG